jgi:hypothetical protein
MPGRWEATMDPRWTPDGRLTYTRLRQQRFCGALLHTGRRARRPTAHRCRLGRHVRRESDVVP